MSKKMFLLNILNSILKPIGIQIYREGFDMKSVLKRFPKQAASSRTIIDIGASTGRWSAMTMPIFPNARFVGIEPLIEREPDLKRLKETHSNFDYVLCVAGEELNGSAELAVSNDLDGSTIGGSEGLLRQVPSNSVDAIVAMKNCQGPFILKFDTHGFEVPILRGAKKTLEETNYIVMEVYNYRHTKDTLLFYEMCALLDTIGFRCFNMADPLSRPLDRSLWQMDFFFARKNDELFRINSFKNS